MSNIKSFDDARIAKLSENVRQIEIQIQQQVSEQLDNYAVLHTYPIDSLKTFGGVVAATVGNWREDVEPFWVGYLRLGMLIAEAGGCIDFSSALIKRGEDAPTFLEIETLDEEVPVSRNVEALLAEQERWVQEGGEIVNAHGIFIWKVCKLADDKNYVVNSERLEDGKLRLLIHRTDKLGLPVKVTVDFDVIINEGREMLRIVNEQEKDGK